MTIESNLTRMADAFERIASALEKLGNASANVTALNRMTDPGTSSTVSTTTVQAVSSNTPETPATTATPEQPKKPKAEKKAETKPETKDEAPSAASANANANDKPVTRDDVRAVARKLIAGSVPDTELQDAIHQVAGVRKISEVPEDKLAAVLAKFNSMLP